MPQAFAEPVHEIDHVIAEQHHGPTTLENLALACFHYNNHKGPNVAGIDPESTKCADSTTREGMYGRRILLGTDHVSSDSQQSDGRPSKSWRSTFGIDLPTDRH